MRKHDRARHFGAYTALLFAGCLQGATRTASSVDLAGDDLTGFDLAAADATGNDLSPSDLDLGAHDLAMMTTTGTNPIYVAAGYDARRMTSTNGTSWPNDTYIAPSSNDDIYNSVVVGNNTIIVAGDPGAFTSTDGTTFTQRTTPATFHHSIAGTFANGLFVFVDAANAYTTTNGITWHMSTNANQSTGHWHAVAYGNGYYLASGDSGARKRSTDGLTWTDYVATDSNASFNSITFGNGTFVGVGQATVSGATVGHSAISVDGVTWTNSVDMALTYATAWGGVTYAMGLFVTSDSNYTWWSTDGKSWTKGGAGFNRGSIAFCDGKFVAASSGYIYESTDGKTFTSPFHDSSPNMYDSTMQPPGLSAIGAGFLN